MLIENKNVCHVSTSTRHAYPGMKVSSVEKVHMCNASGDRVEIFLNFSRFCKDVLYISLRP